MKKLYSSIDEFVGAFGQTQYRAVVMCGLPGSGKSTLARRLVAEFGFERMSSDVARARILKLTPGKFASSADYVKFREQVYRFIRDEGVKQLSFGKRVLFDATNLHTQRGEILGDLQNAGFVPGECVVVLVDGGEKEDIRRRMQAKPGRNQDGRSWEEAWEVAYDFFVRELEEGTSSLPNGEEHGFPVVHVRNYG